jgi:hypothetical protein
MAEESAFKWWGVGWSVAAPSLFGYKVLLFFLAYAVWLFNRRRTYLCGYNYRQPGKVIPHQVLILTISRNSWQWTPEKLQRVHGESLNLPSTLAGALDAMAALGEREKFSWEQMLRAVEVHYKQLGIADSNHLRRLILIGSKGDNGTAHAFEDCRQMIRHYFPGLPEKAVEQRDADFESLEDLIGVYRSIVGSEQERKNEIMLDVTSGTKVVSIAAAMVTLDHPEIEFQYVETHGSKQVRSFNVTTSMDEG